MSSKVNIADNAIYTFQIDGIDLLINAGNDLII